jgi:phosphatidylserine synthase
MNSDDTSMNSLCHLIYVNLANAVSILGVLPLCLLFQEGGYQYLIPLMIYGNVMDDLDGILAAKLNIRSKFGALLDNVCDAIGHSVLVMFIGMHFGSVCAAASLFGVAAIVLRSVTRLGPGQVTGTGSPTNELIRHALFVILLAEIFGFSPIPYLTVVILLNTMTMLLPYRLPYLIRSMTKSARAISLVNVVLVVAWLVPHTTPYIAIAFFSTYLYSLFWCWINFERGTKKEQELA